MKILKIVANNFKLCEDDFTISFVPTNNKTIEHKEYDLHEIDENLFVFSNVGLIGKNASGKTSTVELLELVYDIFSSFTIKSMEKKFLSWNQTINLDITFYFNEKLYRYITDIKPGVTSINNTVEFENQKLYERTYYPTHHNQIFNYDKYTLLETNENLPKYTSLLFNVLKENILRGVIFSCDAANYPYYMHIFNILKIVGDSEKIITLIIKMFDEHIDKIKVIKEDKYKIVYTSGKTIEVTNDGLHDILSRGTSKGFQLYTDVIMSLHLGIDLIVDEIENHFHKNLVLNLINLYKDKSVNKKNATLIFSTHYPELLDTFSRTDNIYILKHDKKITIQNMSEFGIRNELLKSRKFLDNAFGTKVDYNRMMDFKRELMK